MLPAFSLCIEKLIVTQGLFFYSSKSERGLQKFYRYWAEILELKIENK